LKFTFNIFLFLEKKLNKVKGKQSREPTAKDMISALGKVKEDQMHHLMASPQVSVPCDQCLEDSVVNKTHSGKQQNMEEIVAIIYQDALSKEKDENDDEKG
jgi:hypothetical protein